MDEALSYREVRIEKGNLIDRIKNYRQEEWMKACDRLGLFVREDAGVGSHAAVYKEDCPPCDDRTCCVVTLIRGMHPGIQRDIFKKVLAYGLNSGKYSEDDIWKALKIKV